MVSGRLCTVSQTACVDLFTSMVMVWSVSLECEEMQSRKPNGFALILLGAALLPSLACSQNTAEVAAAPATTSVERSAPTPAATVPAGGSVFPVLGPLVVGNQPGVAGQ